MIRFAENLNKMIAAGLGGAMEAPSTEVAVGHRVRYMEASGAVAGFETNIAAPIRSLRVDMLPIQDLHGQDAPYPAGGGINKMAPSAAETKNNNGVTVISDGNGKYTVSGTATGGSANLTFTLNESHIIESGEYLHLMNSAASASAVIALNFSDNTVNAPSIAPKNRILDLSSNVGKTLVSIKFYIVNGIEFSATLQPMIVSSSTAVNFAPYSNICPITGRDSVTVWREASYNPSADPALTIQLGDTVYGGTLDVSTGKLTVTHGEIASYNGEVLTGEWISDRDVYAAGTTPTIGAQVVYVLDTPQTIDLDPQQITTLIGDNNVWSDAGDVSLEYPYYEETEGY